jgi:hypothetical protein
MLLSREINPRVYYDWMKGTERGMTRIMMEDGRMMPHMMPLDGGVPVVVLDPFLDIASSDHVLCDTMMPPRRARGVVFVVVAVIVAALLGHSGVLPGLSHGQPTGAHDTGVPADPHGAGGSHVASCEATMVKTPTCPQATGFSGSLATVAVIDSAIPERGVLLDLTAASRRAPHRSLFLLHASLLI